jgi:hypothetical protein
LVLKKTWSSEGTSLVHGSLNGIKYFIVGMSNDSRSPSSYEVNVFVIINIPGISSLDSIEYDGAPSDGFECTHRGGYSTWH